jgi:F-type H+-transporting ATPase subunit delta
VAALKERLRRDVRLQSETDPSLLGGAILRADDLVIDGSLRGRLERLGAELKA